MGLCRIFRRTGKLKYLGDILTPDDNERKRWKERGGREPKRWKLLLNFAKVPRTPLRQTYGTIGR